MFEKFGDEEFSRQEIRQIFPQEVIFEKIEEDLLARLRMARSEADKLNSMIEEVGWSEEKMRVHPMGIARRNCEMLCC